ncbi:ribosomal RNA-processing protein 8 [Salarias fasciatus]|uniref:Ribosomal RNA-processing protein 8 n=1 Tax=Salarias fasciatus TaxID=181472 RepID=A0A672H2W6_SALFA|nr:ribosomal RNA-processing protein 8 [Salarias fasciatus]
MFNEEADWSDGEDAPVTSPPALTTNSSRKVKVVGKKSLLRTLQTLGSVPAWESEERVQTSDSEGEARPPPGKKKKKRKKKRRRAGTSGEQQENGEESAKEEKPAIKKMKEGRNSGASKAERLPAKEAKGENLTESDQPDAKQPQNSDRLNRQQWKNKMKNKRKCKNKYRQDKPEDGANPAADTQELKKAVEMDPNSNSLKTVEATTRKTRRKELQQQKRDKAEKQLLVKEDKTQSKVGKSQSEIRAAETDQNESKVENADVDKQNTLSPQQRREQSARRERLRKLLQSQTADRPQSPVAEPRDEPAEPEAAPSPADAFRSRMEQRLESARFRYINEVLYSTTSGEARRMFSQDPQAFWVYHKGYTAQVQRWPANPVDGIIAYIKRQSPSLVVADFGCGDCKIARSVKNRVHSFDLAATCELVTVCDMAHVPLEDGSVDIAVFCLSLMGTNLAEFVAEANRVLKMGGVLKVAEVASRFDNVRSFLTALSRLGFKMQSKNTENTHFYSFDFEKTGNVPENVKKVGLQLKPCLYKKR